MQLTLAFANYFEKCIVACASPASPAPASAEALAVRPDRSLALAREMPVCRSAGGGGSFPFLTNHRSRYFNSTTMEFWKIFRLIIVWTMMLILHYISGDNSTGEARAALRGSRAMGPALHLRCSIYV